jgi:hypothetical protein
MAGFYYYIPNESVRTVAENRTLTPDLLARFGLADVLRDCRDVPDHVVVTDVRQGPDGGSGVCLYPKSTVGQDPPGWSYRPDHQTWLDASTHWVGWEKASPPTPADLARRDIYSDYQVIDGLKQAWFVPCARTSDSQRSTLPVEYVFGAADVERRIAPAFHDLWQLSGHVLDYLRGVTERDERWQVETALAVLQTNYRLCKAEVNAMQQMGRAVLTRPTVRAILLCLVDNDLAQEAAEQKKSKS